MVFVQFPVEHIDRVGHLQTQSRHALERIDRKVEAAHLVEHNHIEWSRGGFYSTNLELAALSRFATTLSWKIWIGFTQEYLAAEVVSVTFNRS